MSKDYPDSVFPNNWFTTHKFDDNIPEGVMFTYPMKAPTRQAEVNPKIIKQIGGQYKQVINLTPALDGEALEGTGSLIIDNKHKKVYCSLSERACEATLYKFMSQLNAICKNKKYRLVTFHASDKTGSPIYHTNVLMALLEKHIVFCLDSIHDPFERKRMELELTEGGRQIVDISYDEMGNMCGNMINVKDKRNGEMCLIMSDRAKNNLSKKNQSTLSKAYRIVASDIKMIEIIGGGSARCMVAELY